MASTRVLNWKASCLLFLAIESGHAQTQLDDIEGHWEGTVAVMGTGAGDARHLHTDSAFRVRIGISGDAATVSIAGVEAWELGGGTIARLGASAVIFGVTGVADRKDTWVLTVTKRDQDSLLVFISRVINAGDDGTGVADAFAIGAVGQLLKVDNG